MANHTSIESQKKRLRQYLNPAIRGRNTDAILEALSNGPVHLIKNIEAVNDQIYVATASGRYLDQRMAERNLTRPDNVGLTDDIFRKLGIKVANKKQIRELIMHILEIIYGPEFTRATMNSGELEPYNLSDGNTLILQFDDGESVEIVFRSNQFTNINFATAQEVADAITKELRRLGKTGSALALDDGNGGYVQLMSTTNGPSSTVRVLGGVGQNVLSFPELRPTTATELTQWTLDIEASGQMRATWTGGPSPSIGKIKKNDYVNIFGTAFNIVNRGTFTISKVQGGTVGNAYIEFDNPTGLSEIVVQGNEDAILFYNPYRSTINVKNTFAAAYQTEARLLEIFIPATTKIVRRERKGAAHTHESGSSTENDRGPYIFDETKPYIIGSEECETTEIIDSNTDLLINVDNASEFPDEEGHLIFGFGTEKEEGPVPYISRPSNGTVLINPSYRFINVHESGTNISLVAQNNAYIVPNDGRDYPFYITDVVSGRIYAQDLINYVAATGINIVFTILYPNDVGLGKYNTPYSEKTYVWGEDLS